MSEKIAGLEISVDLTSSKYLSPHHLQVVLDGKVIDVYQEGDALRGVEEGRELWRYDNSPQPGSSFRSLKFDGYDPLLKRAESGREPTGYVIAMLKSSETDEDAHELNRGVGYILNPLTGEIVRSFGPSW